MQLQLHKWQRSSCNRSSNNLFSQQQYYDKDNSLNLDIATLLYYLPNKETNSTRTQTTENYNVPFDFIKPNAFKRIHTIQYFHWILKFFFARKKESPLSSFWCVPVTFINAISREHYHFDLNRIMKKCNTTVINNNNLLIICFLWITKMSNYCHLFKNKWILLMHCSFRLLIRQMLQSVHLLLQFVSEPVALSGVRSFHRSCATTKKQQQHCFET